MLVKLKLFILTWLEHKDFYSSHAHFCTTIILLNKLKENRDCHSLVSAPLTTATTVTYGKQTLSNVIWF